MSLHTYSVNFNCNLHLTEVFPQVLELKEIILAGVINNFVEEIDIVSI